MELIKEEKFDKRIAGEFDYNFNIEIDCLYLIEIIASCRSWWQNLIKLISFFQDDDLTVKIDGISFSRLNGRQGLFDGEVAWNGNNLKGLKKTNIFFLYLTKGQHAIRFLADQKPYLETLKIYSVSVKHPMFNISLGNNNPAEDGNRRQWFTIILANQSLKKLSIIAKAGERKGDDDDMKLIIDSEIQKNAEPKSHKYWYWCGRTLSGKEKEFSKETNLSRGLHYIELWADRMPVLREASFNLGEKINEDSSLQIYTYRGVDGDEDYNKFDGAIRSIVKKWNDEFLAQEYPLPEPLDPNLVKAIIYIESRIGYEKEGYPDVMQVANENDPAIHTLNNDGWIDPKTGKIAKEYEWQNGEVTVLDYGGKAKIEKPEDSIKWGVRWLYHKAQEIKDNKRVWRRWKEAVYRYGPGTKSYVEDIWKVYEKGLSRKGIRLRSFLFSPFLVAVLVSSWWLISNQGRVYISFEDIEGTKNYRTVAKIIDGLSFKKIWIANTYLEGFHADEFLALDKNNPIQTVYLDLDNDSEEEFIVTGSYFDWETTKYIFKKKGGDWKQILNRGEFGGLEPAFSSESVYFEDTDRDGKLEAVEESIISYLNAPHQKWSTYYRLNDNNVYEFFEKKKEAIEGN